MSLLSESAAIPPEMQQLIPGDIQGFPYFWFSGILLYACAKKK